LTVQKRQSTENGIWLCQNCAKLVDNDSERYPAEQLRSWKAQAEASALVELKGKSDPKPIDLSAEMISLMQKFSSHQSGTIIVSM
jgi:hypothetical protein